MEKKSDWKRELFQIIKILQDNSIDVTAIPTTMRRSYTTLKDIRQESVDIESVIRDNQLDGDYRIGQKLNYFRLIYNGTIRVQMSNEERIMAEKLGIVEKIPSGRQKAVFKGRKISQFHIDFINKHLSEILDGKLNTKEALNLMREASISENETIIEDAGSIKRIVEILLKDKPEELKKYKQTVKHNTGKRTTKGTITRDYNLGEYHVEEEKFKRLLIEVYLPKYIKGEITLDKIEKELKTSHKYFNKIVREYYENSGDIEGLEIYEKRKKDNQASTIEQRESAKRMRDEVEEYEVVSNAEFLLLSEAEQDNQIIMKVRQSKLKEEKSKEKPETRVTTKETTINTIEKNKQYFRNKNDYDNGIENFSEQDIRYMIFRYPTLINRSNQTLDEKFEILTSYDEIDEQTAYGMIKTFPAIAGYSADRIKEQLELLQKENLIDAIISSPTRMMQSANLMYALIQYAKERHKASDLSDVNRSNIFMANSTIKRLYGETYEELKKRFPYDISKVDDKTCTVSGENIGRATYKDVNVIQSDKAARVVNEILNKTKENENVN